MNTSSEMKTGQDLFQYYIHAVAEFLSGDNFSPSYSLNSRLVGTGNGSFGKKKVVREGSACHQKNQPLGSGSLFCNPAGDGLSSFEKARLITMLRQSVVALKREVDEISKPVFAINRLRSLLAPTKSFAKCNDETEKHPSKRRKVPSSSSLVNDSSTASPVSCNPTEQGSSDGQKGITKPGESLTSCYNKGCTKYSKPDNDTLINNPDESKFLCGDCLKQANKVSNHKNMNEPGLGSSSKDDKDHGEVNDGLQFLLANSAVILEKMEKHSTELSAMLGHMQEKIEELLDIVVSRCRPMIVAEKHQLRRLIQNLPQVNLDRVVEIIQRGKPSEEQSSDAISINLLQEDHLTLWRLYFYVKAVANAQKLVL